LCLIKVKKRKEKKKHTSVCKRNCSERDNKVGDGFCHFRVTCWLQASKLKETQRCNEARFLIQNEGTRLAIPTFI